MIDVLDEPDDVAVVYLDDIVLFGDDPDKLWEAAVKVIYNFITAGFMLNIKKQSF